MTNAVEGLRPPTPEEVAWVQDAYQKGINPLPFFRAHLRSRRLFELGIDFKDEEPKEDGSCLWSIPVNKHTRWVCLVKREK